MKYNNKLIKISTIKKLTFVALVCGVSGCGFNQHGIRVYTPTTSTGKDGQSHQGSALLLAVNGDAVGLKTLSAGDVKLDFDTAVQGTVSIVTTNKDGSTTTTTKPVVAGYYTSEVTRAQGEADKSRIDSAAAGATGVLSTAILSAAAGPIAGGVTGAVKP